MLSDMLFEPPSWGLKNFRADVPHKRVRSFTSNLSPSIHGQDMLETLNYQYMFSAVLRLASLTKNKHKTLRKLMTIETTTNSFDCIITGNSGLIHLFTITLSFVIQKSQNPKSFLSAEARCFDCFVNNEPLIRIMCISKITCNFSLLAADTNKE